MNKFLLLRHCEPNWQTVTARGLKGWGVDLVCLTESGKRHAKALANDFREDMPDIIITSPMTRCLQTATILCAKLSIPVEVEFDLHEWIPDLSFKWDNYEFVKRAEQERELCHGEWPDGKTCSWEPISKVKQRAIDVLTRYQSFNTVLVVSHALVLKSLSGMNLEYGSWESFRLPSSR